MPNFVKVASTIGFEAGNSDDRRCERKRDRPLQRRRKDLRHRQHLPPSGRPSRRRHPGGRSGKLAPGTCGNTTSARAKKWGTAPSKSRHIPSRLKALTSRWESKRFGYGDSGTHGDWRLLVICELRLFARLALPKPVSRVARPVSRIPNPKSRPFLCLNFPKLKPLRKGSAARARTPHRGRRDSPRRRYRRLRGRIRFHHRG